MDAGTPDRRTLAPVAYDVEAVRAQFPSLASGVAHFDGPGGSQVPQVVGDAVGHDADGVDREPR